MPDNPALTLTGSYVNLLDDALPVVGRVALQPGEYALLLDLDRLDRGHFQSAAVVAAAARVEDERCLDRGLRFRATGPADTWAAIRARLPAPPIEVTANGIPIDVAWHIGSRTALLRHPNTPDGLAFSIRW